MSMRVNHSGEERKNIRRLETENQPAKQALIVWGVFIGLNILLTGTIPFVLGKDLQIWTVSPIRGFLFNLIQYGLMFLVVPLILTKGWKTVRQPGFLIALLIGIICLTLRDIFRPVAAISVLVLVYLHARYNLSELGFHSRGWRGDMLAVLLIALLSSVQRLFSDEPFLFHPTDALFVGLDRLFLNPASTTEYIFYFGFLAEHLSQKLGRWWTPLLIGFMYTLHEMTNPEYWYEEMFFPMIFVGIALFTVIYLWRRNVIAIWLGDGLGRFLIRLF